MRHYDVNLVLDPQIPLLIDYIGLNHLTYLNLYHQSEQLLVLRYLISNQLI